MPSKWYKRKLKTNERPNQIHPIKVVNNSIISSNGTLTLNKIQDDVYKIIDSITLRMELDKVLVLATDFRDKIKTQKDALDLIEQIEGLVFSIIDNIACRIDLGIVKQRITYLKDLITKMNPVCCIEYEGPFADMILEIFTMLSKAIDIDVVKTSLESVYGTIHKSVLNDQYIREAERIMINIFDNIACRIDLGIITQRINYVLEIIKKVDDTCILYNTEYSQEIINIITTISKIGSSSTDIVTEMDTIKIKIQLLHNVLYKQVECMNTIKESETLLLGIIDNIVCRVDLGIVNNRLIYLQNMIDKIKAY
jgi:hypothetical protein